MKESQVSNSTSIEKINSQTNKNSNVQSQSNTETNSNTVTFYKPDEISDYDKILAKMRENNEPYSDIGIVKSVTNSNTKQNDTQAVRTQEQSNTSVNKANNNSSEIKIEKKEVTVTQSFWDRYKWYFIGIGIILIVATLFWLNKKFSFFTLTL